MIQVSKAWRCQNCGDYERIFCGDCSECGEDKGYKRTFSIWVSR